MAGFLPASESDLYRSRPFAEQTGVFPNSALLGQEKILFEARPSLFALHPLLIAVPLPFLFLFTAAGLYDAAAAHWDPLFTSIMAFLLFLIALPILYAVSSWRRRAYALTDQRVLARNGDAFDIATYDDVQDVTMKPGTSKIIFELTPPPPGQAMGLFGPRTRRLIWTAVPGAPSVASFAKSAAAFYRLRNRQRQLRENLVVASMNDRIVCAYCGGLIDVASLSPDNPRCPRCAAPITVAPTGF